MGQILSVTLKGMASFYHNVVSTIKFYTSSNLTTPIDNDNSTSPLLPSAMEGDLSTIEKLTAPFFVENKNKKEKESLESYVNMLDPAQNTALHGAVFGGHIHVVKFLVEKCNADIFGKNNLGCSPLWLAAGYGHAECFEYLLSQTKSSSNSNDNIVKHVFHNQNNTGDSLLLASASRGHEQICQVLLESSIKDDIDGDVTSKYEYSKHLLMQDNQNGDTPLTVAVSNAEEETGCMKLVNTLLKYDQIVINNPNPTDSPTIKSNILDTPNNKGLTPLLIACERNLPKVITLLLETWGAGLLSDQQGNSPLAIASFCGNVEAVEAILKIPPTPAEKSALNSPNDKGCTPLWLACRTGNAKMVHLLLDAGADLTLRNGDNISPLEVAEKYKKEKVLEVLNEWTDGKLKE